MNLSLGENIKRIRLERGLTQEEVASHLGVSFQSVSKWERGEGYPDIELLPSLAIYYGKSIDELLGADEDEKKKQYNEINSAWSNNNRNGCHEENVALMKKALRSFPNDALLLVQLSTSLEKLDGTKEEKEKYLRQSVAVQEQIINFCPDCEVRGATLYNICFAYEKLGEHEKALNQAKKLPNLYKARENALSYLLTGGEKRQISLEALTPLAWCIAHHLSVLGDEANDPSYRKKALDIIDILFPDENKDVYMSKIYESLRDTN